MISVAGVKTLKRLTAVFNLIVLVAKQVFVYISSEKCGILVDNAKEIPVCSDIMIKDIYTIQQDFPLIFVKTQQELENGRFAATWFTYECYLLTSFYFETHIV